MRFVLLLLPALLASAASPGAQSSLGWIADAGGEATRDAQGRVVAIDLRASWVGDSDLASLAGIPTLAGWTSPKLASAITGCNS